MKDALLIIDMQEGCFKTPRFDRTGTAERINTLSESYRKHSRPVIFVQHNGTKEGYLYPGTGDFEIIKELTVRTDDYFIEKQANDSFYRTKLEKLLNDLNIDTLVIAGLATDFCVNATVHSALVKDFNLIIASDCHTTADKVQIKAEDIIEYHNFLWANLTPTDGKILLYKSSELVKK